MSIYDLYFSQHLPIMGYIKQHDGDRLVLRSFNPTFGDFVVDEDDEAEIVGVVKERFSKDAFVV